MASSVIHPPPLPSREAVADLLLDAAESVLDSAALAHHLAKASIERWFAFEIARYLDAGLTRLDPPWVALVECGGGGKRGSNVVGNFDLLLVPASAAAKPGLRLRPGPWSAKAVAIEIKGAHLGDGITGKHCYNRLSSKTSRRSQPSRLAGTASAP